MVKRICPICDQAMKGKHYCPVCRSYVKNPIIMNRDYYLNERHPAYETDCEYHNPAISREQKPQIKKTAQGQTTKPGSGMPAYGGSRNQTGRRIQQKQTGPVYTPAGTGKKAGNPVTSFILIFIVIMFLISLLSAVIPFMMFAL